MELWGEWGEKFSAYFFLLFFLSSVFCQFVTCCSSCTSVMCSSNHHSWPDRPCEGRSYAFMELEYNRTLHVNTWGQNTEILQSSTIVCIFVVRLWWGKLGPIASYGHWSLQGIRGRGHYGPPHHCWLVFTQPVGWVNESSCLSVCPSVFLCVGSQFFVNSVEWSLPVENCIPKLLTEHS